jgi:dynein heavy chain
LFILILVYLVCNVSGEFRNLVDVNFACAMGPPGGGRNVVTARLLRHFNFLTFIEMEDPSKRKIFSTILKSWISTYCFDLFLSY